jgi:adenosylhomocysteine nucleosidase
MIGVIGAMEKEIEILKAQMSALKIEKKARFEFYRGILCGKEIVLLQCGIGKVQAAVGCALLLESYKPEFIINTGTAGGVNPSGCTPLGFGDAVISSGMVYHDVDVTVFGYKPGQVPGDLPQIFPANKKLIEFAHSAVAKLKAASALPENFNAIEGLISSGDQFMSNSQKIIELCGTFPALRAVEMEGAAIAHTAYIFNTPFLVLRCISDIAGEESPIKHDEYVPIASKHSSEIVKAIVADFEAGTLCGSLTEGN